MTSRLSRTPRRPGRPPKDEVGTLDARLLDAAEALFLEHGFDGTSVAAVAALAGASKQTIYHRHPTKDLLFEAVVERAIDRFLGNVGRSVTGRTVEARILNLATLLAEGALDPGTLLLMRMVIGEVARFGNLAKRLDVSARRRVERYVLDTGELDALVDPAQGPKARTIAARQLINLSVHVVVLRALLGADPATLRREAGPMLKENVGLFLRGLRR